MSAPIIILDNQTNILIRDVKVFILTGIFAHIVKIPHINCIGFVLSLVIFLLAVMFLSPVILSNHNGDKYRIKCGRARVLALFVNNEYQTLIYLGSGPISPPSSHRAFRKMPKCLL